VTVYIDPGVTDPVIQALLEGTPAVTALATGGIYQDQAHDGADVPFVVFQAVSDVPMLSLGGGSEIATINYLVRCVSDQQDIPSSRALAAAVNRALHGAVLTVPGYSPLCLLKAGGGQRYADDSGFYNVASYYKLILYSNS
jgi:hypothetical protein